MDVQTVSIALAGIGIFIAAINFIVTSRKADQQRQMELFTQLYNQILTEDFIRNFREVMSYDIDDFDEWLNLPPTVADKRDHIHGLLAYICVVINKGLIAINLVDDIIAVRVIQY